MSRRKALDGIDARYSLHEGLPATYREDDFTDRFVRSFDDVVAPLHASVDDLDAYFDPQIAPMDFLAWLGGWLGIEVNHRWPAKRRRDFVAKAVEAYRLRGTLDGIAMAVELYTGLHPSVSDNGGVSASPEPLGEIPGSAGKLVTVTLRRSDNVQIDAELVDRIVGETKPVGVGHRVQIID